MPKQLKSNEFWKERIKRYTIGTLIFLVVYLALILFYIYPHRPIDATGWSILFLAGIPISLCLEWIGESIFSKKTGLKISGSRISAKRIMFVFFIFAVIAGALTFLWFIFGHFIRQHFIQKSLIIPLFILAAEG